MKFQCRRPQVETRRLLRETSRGSPLSQARLQNRQCPLRPSPRARVARKAASEYLPAGVLQAAPGVLINGGLMRVLVTGGTGFTGTALVKRLIDEGHSVVALDYKEGLQSQALRSYGAEVVLGSVTD